MEAVISNRFENFGMTLTKVATVKDLRKAFHKVAMRKSAATKERVLEVVKKEAFGSELQTIDPELANFAKMAGWLGDAWSSVKSGFNKAVGFVKDNWVDIALTAAMFIPGLNVVAGIGRAAMVAGRGIRAGMALNKGLRGMSAVSKLKNIGTGIRHGARGVAKTIGKGGRHADRFRYNRILANQAKNPAIKNMSKQIGTQVSRQAGASRSLMAARAPGQGLKGWAKKWTTGRAGMGSAAMNTGMMAMMGGVGATKNLMGIGTKQQGAGYSPYGAHGRKTTGAMSALAGGMRKA